jgi:predicted nucleic acid-binding protein
MREHGVTEIMTGDTDFRKFAFLSVIDPVRRSG